MKRAYIFGCSHAAGSEMFDNDIDREYTHSYPALIARDLGYVVHNHAIPGGSNDAIFRILSELIDSIDNTDLVLLCWTGPDRAEVFSEEDDQWLQFAVGRSHFNNVEPHPVARQGRYVGSRIRDEAGWNQFFQAWQRLYLGVRSRNSDINHVRNVMAANALATQRTQHVHNIKSFAGIPHEHWSMIQHWSWPVARQDFGKFAKDHGFAHTPLGHFFYDAHRAFADAILSVLQPPHNIKNLSQLHS